MGSLFDLSNDLWNEILCYVPLMEWSVIDSIKTIKKYHKITLEIML